MHRFISLPVIQMIDSWFYGKIEAVPNVESIVMNVLFMFLTEV